MKIYITYETLNAQLVDRRLIMPIPYIYIYIYIQIPQARPQLVLHDDRKREERLQSFPLFKSIPITDASRAPKSITSQLYVRGPRRPLAGLMLATHS